MLIKAVVNKWIDIKELEELELTRVHINKTINKHRRKLIRLKLYINWETKFQDRKVKLFISRLISLRLFGDRKKLTDLTISFNSMSSLINCLKTSTKKYLELIKTL